MIVFDGEFALPGAPDEVMRRLQDVERMASCLPGAALEPADPSGAHPGSVLVAFGPKKIKFSGSLTCRFDQAERTGVLEGRGAAAVRSANAAVKATFQVQEAEEPWKGGGPQSRVAIHSEAQFGGVLAEFAKTGGAALCAALMDEFSRNAAIEFGRDAAPQAEAAAAPPPPPAPALSATRLLWASFRRMLRGFFHRRSLP